LIKPSHYDDEGYVIQWLRSAIPSNTEDEFDELEMFAVSESAKAAVEKKRREDGQRARLKAAS
jgi:hypothetical protein